MPNNKDIKKLNRRELLEMLVIQSRRVEELEETVKHLNAKLEDRNIVLTDAGNIAKAALELNGIFEVAQKAADQYLENIERLHRESELVLDDAARKAASLISHVESEKTELIADLLIEEGKKKKKYLVTKKSATKD